MVIFLVGQLLIEYTGLLHQFYIHVCILLICLHIFSCTCMFFYKLQTLNQRIHTNGMSSRFSSSSEKTSKIPAFESQAPDLKQSYTEYDRVNHVCGSSTIPQP